MSFVATNDRVPLCVNCEHALLKTNLFQEAVFLYVRRHPLNIFLLPIWLLRNKSSLIQKMSQDLQINWRTVPLWERVVERVRAALNDGRRVIFLTAMPQPWSQMLSKEFAGSEVILQSGASGSGPHATAASSLIELFGLKGFDYIGDGRSDLAVCESARRVLLVTSDRAAIAEANAVSLVESVVPKDRTESFAFFKMIRVHQWVKNLLIWVPLLAAHKLTSIHGIALAAEAFLAFSFCASSVYVLNDLLDVESDRQHARKRNRPLAAGKIEANHALLAGLLLFVAAVWLSLRVSNLFTLTVAIYFAMTLAYSMRLKRQVIVDVMLLAALYTIRVVAGAVATTVVPSFWLLAFSMFLFLSLAVVKRYSEMLVTLSQDKLYAAGRGYSVEDLPVLLSLGMSTGVAAIVVLALYINDPSTSKLYPTTIWLWPVPPLMLYWISRVWMKAHRGEMHDDPVVFAMRDWQSLLTVVLGGLCFTVAAMH